MVQINNKLNENYLLVKEIDSGSKDRLTFEEYGLQISKIAQIGESLEYESTVRLSSAVLIGACRIGAFTYIGGGSEIRRSSIGRFCSIAANVAIGPAEHPIDWLSSHPFVCDGYRHFDCDSQFKNFVNPNLRFLGNSASTEVGNDVWIGRNVIIRQGVKVGSGAIIAGGSFVNKDVPDYAVVGGVPARLIKYRFDETTIQLLKSIKWWNFKLDSIKHSIDFSDIQKSIECLSSLIGKGKLEIFLPRNYLFTRNNSQVKIYSKKDHLD